MKTSHIKSIVIVCLTLAGLAVLTACVYPEGPERRRGEHERWEENRDRGHHDEEHHEH